MLVSNLLWNGVRIPKHPPIRPSPSSFPSASCCLLWREDRPWALHIPTLESSCLWVTGERHWCEPRSEELEVFFSRSGVRDKTKAGRLQVSLTQSSSRTLLETL